MDVASVHSVISPALPTVFTHTLNNESVSLALASLESSLGGKTQTQSTPKELKKFIHLAGFVVQGWEALRMSLILALE